MSDKQLTTTGDTLRGALTKLEDQFSTALPKHIPVDRFMRVVLTAVNSNPDLVNAYRPSLFEAAMKAAQDGLLPDGRDGAFVVFNKKIKRGNITESMPCVQWMPMIGGILKKVRNSGDLKTISAQVVYEKDKFVYKLGDDEKIEHEPFLDGDPGQPKLVYAVAHTTDGGIYREVMTIAQVNKVRNVSRAKAAGPWVDWWDEMAKKTVLRRLSKRLPMSSDLDDLVRRDDDLYDFKGTRAEPAPFTPVQNPLRDEDPAEQLTDQSGETDAPATADLIVDAVGRVHKIRADGKPPETVLDQRFPEEPFFETAEEWRACLAENDLPDPTSTATGASPKPVEDSVTAQEAPQEAAKAVSDNSGADGPADSENAPATARNAGKPASEAKAAPKAADKPYKDAETYLAWLDAELAKASGVSAIREIWGNSKQDRADMLTSAQIEDAAKRKNDAVERLKVAK